MNKNPTNSKLKLNEIKELCKYYGVKSTGTKTKLLDRIRIAKFLEKNVNNTFQYHSNPKCLSFKEYKNGTSSCIDSYQKFFSFVSKNKSNEIIGKLDNRNSTFHDLTKEDIDYCKSRNIPYVIPIILTGKEMTHRTRTVVEEEEFDEEGEDICE